MIALYIIIALIGGVLLGYFYSNSKNSKTVLERELALKENELLKAQIENWSKFKEESLSASKAVMFEVSNQISAKLIDDHKRENNEAKKQSEEITKKTTEELVKSITKVTEKLATVDNKVEKNESVTNIIWDALKNPIKANNYAEIGLENTLRNYGFELGKDFEVQYSMSHEGGRARPDAVIFLAYGNLMVIDAKSTNIVLELAQDNSEKLLEKLRVAMDRHINQLASRDYISAAKSSSDQDVLVYNVMYLANSVTLAKIEEADLDFREKCIKKNIIPADPSTLHLLINAAKLEILRVRQDSNSKEILKEIGKVVSSLDMYLRNLAGLGDSLKKVFKNYNELTSSANTRLLPRVRKVLSMGLEPEKETKLPPSIPSFSITENESLVLENAADDDKPNNLIALDKKAAG